MERVYLIANYNVNPSLLISTLDSEIIIYDHSEDDVLMKTKFSGNVTYLKKPNYGHNLADYLEYIIENYNNLPSEIGFLKGNIIGRHITEEVFRERLLSKGFIPLYSDDKTFAPKTHNSSSLLLKFGEELLYGRNRLIAQQTSPGLFMEIANNWYVKKVKKGKCFPLVNDMFEYIFSRNAPKYLTFVPGGCMIVKREKVLRWPKNLYVKLFEAVTYDHFTVEVYHLERLMVYLFEHPLR